MAGEGWVVVGAAIGVIGSVGTTWLNAWLGKNQLDAYDRAAMSLLKDMLNKGSGLADINRSVQRDRRK
jgi:hypothetical protein